jgi:hypothetical protein
LVDTGNARWLVESAAQRMGAVTFCFQEKVAGVLGIEPRNVGTKNRCLTAWRHPKKGGQIDALALWRKGFDHKITANRIMGTNPLDLYTARLQDN